MAEVSHGSEVFERKSSLVISNHFSCFAGITIDQNWSLCHFNLEFLGKFSVFFFVFLNCLKEQSCLVRLHLSVGEHLVLDVSEVPSLLLISDTSDNT